MAQTYERGSLYKLALSSVHPDPEQPRKYFDPQALTELTASIASHGVATDTGARKRKRHLHPS